MCIWDKRRFLFLLYVQHIKSGKALMFFESSINLPSVADKYQLLMRIACHV